MPTQVKTGVGRIVWGHPLKAQIKKDQNTKQVILKDGQPVKQWAMGIAFPKAEFAPIWQAMSSEVATGFPQGVPSNFSWKMVDGDTIDKRGQPYNKREGYAGCYVLTVSTEAFAPSVFRFDPAQRQYVQLSENEIKTGDYVVLATSFQVNVPQNRTHTPSLYVNPQAIEFVAYGQPIISQADPMELFGGQTYALPPGASAAPQAPQHNVGMPGMPQGAPQPGYQQPGGYPQPQPGYTPQGGPISTGPMPGMMQPGAPGMQPGGPMMAAPQVPYSGGPALPPGSPAPYTTAPGYPAAPNGMPPGAPGNAAYPSSPQQPGYPPQGAQQMQQPGYPPQGMQPATDFTRPPQGAPQMQQPMPGQPQPGMMQPGQPYPQR